ncbi:MAG: MFS transporter [Chloroflexota bacterium]|nr:MFS transporter [Chloroflexota bacterium]MDE2942142.1 MFS transporter [Chloroflexota bacterium]MDE3268026.1 MFS transporter [Chloroflexota bacterium]
MAAFLWRRHTYHWETVISTNGGQSAVEGSRPARRLGPLRALAYPQFRIFWAASLVSITSFFMTMIARGWLVLELTDSEFMVTGVNAIGMAPMLAFSVFGGAIADRANRKLVLIASDVFNFVIVLALAVVILTDVVEVWHVFALTALHGVGFSLGMPARAASVGNLVERQDLASGVALFTTIFSAAMLVGPALAGYLLAAFDMGFTFVAACAVLAPALALLFALRIPRTAGAVGAPQQSTVLGSIVQGFGYVRRANVLIGLMLMGTVTTVFAMPYQTLLPVFARDILNAGESGLGWLGAMGGAGAIAGSISVAAFSNPRQMKLLMLAGGLALGVFIALFAVSTVFLLSLALALIVGYLLQIFMTSNFTLVQVISPDYIRGRVLSIRMIAVGIGPVGMVMLGAAAEEWGAAAATAMMGLISTGLLVAILLANSSVRRVDREAASVSAGSAQEAVAAEAGDPSGPR